MISIKWAIYLKSLALEDSATTMAAAALNILIFYVSEFLI